MKTIKTVLQQYCHEFRALGDMHTSYGFGNTPEFAREKAVYGVNEPSADCCLGFGDWKLQEDSGGDHWATQINKNA